MGKAAKSEVVVRFPGRDAVPAVQAVAAGDFDQRLCEHLIAAGKLARPSVERALRLSAEQQAVEPLRALLVKLGLVSESDLAAAMAALLGLPLVERKDFPESMEAEDGVSFNFLKNHKALIVGEEGDRLNLAMADPQDNFVLKAIRLITGKDVRPCVAIPSEIEQALDERRAHREGPQNEETPGPEDGSYRDDVEHLKELASGAPVIRLVNQIMHRAAQSGASDVHIEPFESRLKVRYRIDGVLQEMESPSADASAAVISRVKIMANLNIAERRLPQDGRFKMRVAGQVIDLRVSTTPTVYGESLVLRLLRHDDAALDFGPLGYDPATERSLRRVLELPHGILLVTGPTGSGKTTTLYAALRHLNTSARKIITVEDPVEYHIEGVNQIQVKPQIGLTFANALRSIVRQDPDVIMIGEMRDTETAKIAVQSALTGHLVLSTLHTNDAAGSITRLLDMGVEDYLLASTVNAVMAQRLVRKLCPRCRQPYTPAAEEIRHWRLDRFTKAAAPTLYRARGCEQCGGTGYRGRNAIVELLVMSDPLRRLVLEHPEAGRIGQQAATEGTRSMFEDGLVKALAGTTTIEEVVRVTQEN
jgi:general secretion pathway protein E